MLFSTAKRLITTAVIPVVTARRNAGLHPHYLPENIRDMTDMSAGGLTVDGEEFFCSSDHVRVRPEEGGLQ